jgi:hypothetical protein
MYRPIHQKSFSNLLLGDSYFKLCTTTSGTITFNPNPADDVSTIKDELPFFNGTLIGIDLSIDDTEAFNNLMKRIGEVYQLSVKKGKKNYYKRIKFV